MFNICFIASDGRDRMAAEQSQAKEMNFNVKDLPRTTNIVSALLERLELLLQVTIAPEIGTGITRSTSCIPEMSHAGELCWCWDTILKNLLSDDVNRPVNIFV